MMNLCAHRGNIINILSLSFAGCFKLPFMSPALDPGIYLTIVPGVSFTYRKAESPITRVGFSVGVSPSGEKRLATWSGRWWTTGLCFGLRFLRTATRPPWLLLLSPPELLGVNGVYHDLVKAFLQPPHRSYDCAVDLQPGPPLPASQPFTTGTGGHG